MIDLGGGINIDGYRRINVILGKNGSGKSTLLRRMDEMLSSGDACIRYITPERGGVLTYDGGIESNRSNDPSWLWQIRRCNNYNQFRQSSVAEYRSLETLVLRTIESDQAVRSSDFKFEQEIGRINTVLDRVALKRSVGSGFEITRMNDQKPARPSDLSSGESELISLAVEILNFSYMCKQEKHANTNNWLLLDEPDVHLHPDLQGRLMKLLVDCLKESNGNVLIATHSTAILAALCSLYPETMIGFKNFEDKAIRFCAADEALKTIIPIFGAHPLSNVFNQRPPIIVEGEDDERIWQTAVRSSQGRVSVYPCVAGDVRSMNAYEATASTLMNTVYENARAFSLRDKDDNPYEIEDIGPVVRCRLNCRTAENLILTDDVLNVLGSNWVDFRHSFEIWIANNPEHSRIADAVAFRNSGWDRQNFNVKGMRMVIVGITGSTKLWEVAVGQAIAKIASDGLHGKDSLREYLGSKIVKALGLDK